MISSYQFSQRVDTVSIIATGLSSLFALLRTLALVLLAGAALAGVFAVVALFWLPICQFVGGLLIVGAFAMATYPRSRKAVRNG